MADADKEIVSHRWPIIIAIIGGLITFAGVMIERELSSLSSRMDRITNYVLDNCKKVD